MACHPRVWFAGGLLLVVLIAASDAAEREAWIGYLIEPRLVEKGPHGETRVMAEPHIVTTEGRPATLRVGGEVPTPDGVDPMELLHVGNSFTLRVFRGGNRLFLDITAEVADVSRRDADGVRITTRGLRLVEAITLGKPIVVPIGPAEAGKPTSQWEVVVRRATPDVMKKVAATPAPRAQPAAAPSP